MFEVGTRVIVADEEKARRTPANVHKGQKGTVIHTGSFRGVCVRMDGDGYDWYMPPDALREIKLMSELSDKDALAIAQEYYSQFFRPEATACIVAALAKVDIAGLIRFAHDVGTTDERLRKYD